MTLLSLLSSAALVVASWRSCTILAVEAERQLLDLGFYNVNFRGRRVTACYNGNEFELEE